MHSMLLNPIHIQWWIKYVLSKNQMDKLQVVNGGRPILDTCVVFLFFFVFVLCILCRQFLWIVYF